MEVPKWPIASVKTLRLGPTYIGGKSGKLTPTLGSRYMLIPTSVVRKRGVEAGMMWDCYELEDGSLLYRPASGVVFTELHAEIEKAAEVVVLPKVELTVDVEEAPVGEFFADNTERDASV